MKDNKTGKWKLKLKESRRPESIDAVFWVFCFCCYGWLGRGQVMNDIFARQPTCFINKKKSVPNMGLYSRGRNWNCVTNAVENPLFYACRRTRQQYPFVFSLFTPVPTPNSLEITLKDSTDLNVDAVMGWIPFLLPWLLQYLKQCKLLGDISNARMSTCLLMTWWCDHRTSASSKRNINLLILPAVSCFCWWAISQRLMKLKEELCG